MAEAKDNYKTFYYRRGQTWFSEESGAVGKTRVSLAEVHTSAEETVKSRYATFRNVIKPTYVSYDDFEDLRIQFEKMEQKIRRIEGVHSSGEMEIAISDALCQLGEVKGIDEIKNHSENGNLTLLVTVKDFSADLFRRIADVEIALARKYLDLRVEIQPIMRERRKSKESCEQK